MPLFPFIPPYQDETALSFAGRLAARHIDGRTNALCTDLGIKSLDLAAGKREAVEMLCERAGVEASLVLRNTPISVAKRTYELRGEVLSAEMLSSPATKFCPACLLADDRDGEKPGLSRYNRLGWTLTFVRTCPVHQIPLVSVPRRAWDDQFHELAYRAPTDVPQLEAMITASGARVTSPMQEYAENRLNGANGPDWLDAQSLEQAVHVTEMLGTLVLHGTRGVSELDDDAWDEAGRVGFEFTMQGEEGIRTALYQIQQSHRLAGGKPQFRNVFGRLYEAAASPRTAREPGDIRRILREHIFDTVPLAAGEVVLGEALERRKLHTVATLASETGHHPQTLRNVFIAKGIVDRETPQKAFDADFGRDIARRVQDVVHVIALPKRLGCSRPQASALLDERILETVFGEPTNGPGRLQKTVAKADVDRLLRRIETEIPTVDDETPDLVSLSKACEKAKIPFSDLIHLVLGGYLTSVARISPAAGLSAIRVSPAEISSLAAEVAGLSAVDVAGRLRCPVATVWALTNEKHGRIAPRVIECPNGAHQFTRIGAAQLEEFASSFVTVNSLSEATGLERSSVLRELRTTNARPTIPAAECGIDFYSVADLPNRLLLGRLPLAS